MTLEETRQKLMKIGGTAYGLNVKFKDEKGKPFIPATTCVQIFKGTWSPTVKNLELIIKKFNLK